MAANYVIIGGPCSGKTTVIERLGELGFETVPESARLILQELKISDPRLIRDSFQNHVFQRQLEAELEISSGNAPCFLDGGIFDGCAYYLNDGLAVPRIFDTVNGARYKRAFLFEPLDFFINDGVRYQSTSSNEIAELLFQSYSGRGVPIERIPNMQVDRRVSAICEIVQKQAQSSR